MVLLVIPKSNCDIPVMNIHLHFNFSVAVVSKEEAQKAVDTLNALGEKAWVLGEIAPVGADGKQVTIKNYENF